VGLCGGRYSWAILRIVSAVYQTTRESHPSWLLCRAISMVCPHTHNRLQRSGHILRFGSGGLDDSGVTMGSGSGSPQTIPLKNALRRRSVRSPTLRNIEQTMRFLFWRQDLRVIRRVFQQNRLSRRDPSVGVLCLQNII
jgi:hypothetical protein